MRPTASSLPLLASCQWWAGDAVVGRPFQPTPEMLAGTETHAIIEARIEAEPEPVLTSDAAAEFWQSWCRWAAAGGLDELRGFARVRGAWQAEQAFAYNAKADTARSFGRVRGRRYPKTSADEIAGTVDAIAVDKVARTAVVVDWKTGEDRAGLTADASENRQLRGYALAVSRAFDVDEVVVAVVRIKADDVTVTRCTFDALELGEAAEALRQLLAAVPTAQPKPGLHCRRCRAVAECPATAAAADQLAPRSPEPVPLTITTDNAGALLVRLRAVQAACDQVESALREFADANGGVQLDDGKVWRKFTIERQSIRLDGPEAASALNVLDSAGVAAAVEHKSTTSRAAIERALTAQGLKGKAKATRADEIVAELAAAGAVRVSLVDTYKEGTR